MSTIKIILFVFLIFNTLIANTHYLEIPQLQDENVLDLKVGVRPYRKTGIRVQADWFDKKIIVHNYGHGGAGLTLSWGSAQEVLEIVNQEVVIKKFLKDEDCIAIIGAGIMGLCVADVLYDNGYKVKVYAEKLHPDTTSDIAAGFFGSFSVAIPEDKKKKEQFERILKNSEEKLLEIMRAPDQGIKGVCLTDFYIFNTENEDETVYFSNETEKKCCKKEKLIMKGPFYFESIFRKIQEKGIQFIVRKFNNLEEILALPESIIINCTGIGARNLFDDSELIGIKGHLVHLKKDNCNYLLGNADEKTSFFIMPWDDRLVIGSRLTQEFNNDSCVLDIEKCKETLNLARSFFKKG